MATKPPISKTVNRMASLSKYLSIKPFIVSPYFHNKKATKKNLAARLITDAIKNITRFILNAPLEIVNILYGIGVNPAVKIIQKSYCSYIV